MGYYEAFTETWQESKTTKKEPWFRHQGLGFSVFRESAVSCFGLGLGGGCSRLMLRSINWLGVYCRDFLLDRVGCGPSPEPVLIRPELVQDNMETKLNMSINIDADIDSSYRYQCQYQHWALFTSYWKVFVFLLFTTITIIIIINIVPITIYYYYYRCYSHSCLVRVLVVCLGFGDVWGLGTRDEDLKPKPLSCLASPREVPARAKRGAASGPGGGPAGPGTWRV